MHKHHFIRGSCGGRWIAAAASCGFVACAAQAQFGGGYSGGGGALADAGNAPGTAVFTITVLDQGPVGSFSGVTLSNLSHTWCGDLLITITAPDQSSISLTDRIGYPNGIFGDSSNFLGTYQFSDQGSDLWAIATQQGNGNAFNIPGGNYRASGFGGSVVDLASFFVGKSAQGTWTLTVTDFESGDTGSLGGWSLGMTVVPAPGFAAIAAALTAVGLVPLGRRRPR